MNSKMVDISDTIIKEYNELLTFSTLLYTYELHNGINKKRLNVLKKQNLASEICTIKVMRKIVYIRQI